MPDVERRAAYATFAQRRVQSFFFDYTCAPDRHRYSRPFKPRRPHIAA
jgi:hypothetical protein